MNKKKTIISLLFGILLGFGVGYLLPQDQVIPKKEKIDSTIDSVVVKRVEIVKEKVKWREKIITLEKEKEIEKDRIQELPLDSGILWLSEKLKEYEKN